MRAIVINRFGGPEVLEMGEKDDPTPSRGEVLVRVAAAGVNRADLLQRLGRYPAPPDAPRDVPGIEFAGEVEALGPEVDAFRPGDRVFGLSGGGAYAEKIVVHARTLCRMPAGMGFLDAAAVPEAFITAYDAMVVQAGLSAGDTVLVSAVGSGVGTAAVQIARAIGARPLGSSRTQSKLQRARALGLDLGFLVEGDKFAGGVMDATDKKGVDVVLELVGGRYVREDLACLARGGTIVVVGLVGGATAEVDLGSLLSKRATIRGTVLRSRPIEERISVARDFGRHVVPLLEAGRLAPVLDRAFPLAEASAAHAYMATSEGFGKIVLDCRAASV